MKSVLNRPMIGVDLGHLFDKQDGKNFLTHEYFDQLTTELTPLFNRFVDSLDAGEIPISKLDAGEGVIEEIKKTARQWKNEVDNLLILGIGGSTLGFRSILQALKGPYFNLWSDREYPRVYVLDNADPVLAYQVGQLLDFSKTALIYISKSGSTPEPAANFVFFYNLIRKTGGFSKRIAVICDPGDNGINRIARNIGCYLFHIPYDLPGRYSVLSPVGYLPSEMIGVDCVELIDGAAALRDSIMQIVPRDNPVFVLGAALSHLASRGKSIHVLFGYSNLLTEYGLWFSQLWAESLGKKDSLDGLVVNRGMTPISALGATDQHSLLQLFKEGPNDKVYGFLSVQKYPNDVKLESAFPDEKEYSYFDGHTMGEQLHAEKISTMMSLNNARRPCYELILPELSPFTLGSLFYLSELVTVFVANIWNINPFDQPGVEEGKAFTYTLMDRVDFAALKTEMTRRVEDFNKRGRLINLNKL